MTREKALQVDALLLKIETYEALLPELSGLKALDEIYSVYGNKEGEALEADLRAVVQNRLDKLLKELEDM